jgi:hypothetical protein
MLQATKIREKQLLKKYHRWECIKEIHNVLRKCYFHNLCDYSSPFSFWHTLQRYVDDV